MRTYAGIDLHSSNSYIGIIDEQDQKHFGKKLPNSLSQILVALEPFLEKERKVQSAKSYGGFQGRRGYPDYRLVTRR